jgi:hypothetical protein
MIKINHNIFVALASGCATVPGREGLQRRIREVGEAG